MIQFILKAVEPTIPRGSKHKVTTICRHLTTLMLLLLFNTQQYNNTSLAWLNQSTIPHIICTTAIQEYHHHQLIAIVTPVQV